MPRKLIWTQLSLAFPSCRPCLRENQAGSMTVFALGLLVGIFGLGSLAIDAMHYESKRVATQDAMDRCALMAAIAENRIIGGASTGLTSEDVAKDCMSKSSVGSAGLNKPIISSENSEFEVTLSGTYTFSALHAAEGEAASKSFTLSSTSKQKLPNLEITIAVDINHAAFWNNFRGALKTFLNTIAAPDNGNKVTVNIIPFTKNVFLTASDLALMGAKNEPPFTTKSTRTCLALPPDIGNDLGFDMTAKNYSWSWPIYTNDINIGFDYQLNTYPLIGPETLAAVNGWPYVETVHYLPGAPGQIARMQETTTRSNCTYFVHANNTALIGAQVARPVSLTAANPINTKIDTIQAITAPSGAQFNAANSVEAMRWALAVMDPSLKPLFTAKAGNSSSPPAVAGRPLNYDAEDTMKVLIFVPNNVFRMPSTGILTGVAANDALVPTVREIRPEYLDNTASWLPGEEIWRTPDAETTTQSIRYSIRHPDAPDPSKPFWVTRDRQEITETGKAHWSATPFQHPGGGAPVKQTWRDIFSKMSVGYLLRELYVLPMAKAGVLPANSKYHFNTLLDRFTYIASAESELRADFSELCENAKKQGVLIYTLLGNGTVRRGGTTAADTLHNSYADLAAPTYQGCATSPAHTFMAGAPTTIRSALRLISSNIAQLTLTQ